MRPEPNDTYFKRRIFFSSFLRRQESSDLTFREPPKALDPPLDRPSAVEKRLTGMTSLSKRHSGSNPYGLNSLRHAPVH